MATRKSEWLASIKPILDRDEAKRDAKELAKELGDLLEINIDASPENLKKLTDEFNKQLSQMGKQPIVFSEKTLHGIVNQFANAVAEGFSKGANAGLEETFKLQLANLKKQKEALLKEQDDINRRLSNRSRIEKINNFSIESAHGLPVDKDVVKQAEKMLDEMYEYADRISELQEEQGKESEEYISTVLDAQEAYNKFLRLQKSLKKTKPALPKDLKAAYDLFEGDDEDRYRAAGGKTTAFDYDKYGGEIILDAFEEVSDVLINTDDQLNEIQKRLKAIDLQIESIVAQAKAAGAADDTIFGDSKDGLKTLKEIEAAYDRIAKKSKKTGGKALDGVSAAVDYVPGSESLTTLRNRYNTSLSSNEDWEVQYQWLVKFVKEYENYSAQIEAETDSIKRKNMRARQKQYTALYEELKPVAENAETMLRGIIDVSSGKQPTGVKDGGAGPTPEDVANAEQIAGSERQAREDAAAKAKAEAEAAEAAKQKRIEEEKAAKAAEKKRLADEAAAEAQRKAAEEAEKERLAKEASVAADKTRTYTGYRAIEPSESSGKTKHDALADWGAEYFSTDKNVAASYGQDFFKEGNIIIGEITPKNPLVINANGLRWDEFDKMPGLQELFPGLLDLMKQSGYIGDDGQKYINEQAKLAGYDAVVLENVQDALDGDIKEYGLSTTIAVLDDKIVSLTGSMAQLEAGTNRFADVISSEIPSYYTRSTGGNQSQAPDIVKKYASSSDEIKKKYQEIIALQDQIDELERKTQKTPIDIDPWNATKEQKDKIVAAWREYQKVIQEIAAMPIVETEDDEKRLLELKAKAVSLYETMHQGHLNDVLGDGYAKEYGLSIEDGKQMHLDMQDTPRKDFDKSLGGLQSKLNDAYLAAQKLDGEMYKMMLHADDDSIENLYEKIRQDALAAKPAVEALNDGIEATRNAGGTGTGDASSAELEAAVTKTETLQDEVEQKNKELADKDAEIARARAENEVKLKTEADEKDRLREDLNATNQQLADVKHENELYDTALSKATEESNIKDGIIRELREQLANVKTGVSEEQSSVSSEDLKNVLSSIVYNVKIAHDDNDKTANKIAIDESVLEQTLKRVFTNVLNPQTEQNDSEPKNAPWALEKTLLSVNEVLGQIQTNTAKIGTAEAVPSDTAGTSDVVTKLTEIKSVLDSINTKIAKGGIINTQGAVKQAGTQSAEPDVKAQTTRSNIMKSLINDYKTMGKLAAQFASDGNLETKAMLDNLKEEIRRKRDSLKITMDENAGLREKYSIAFDAEKRLIEAEKQQKEINDQRKADAKSEKKRFADAKKMAQREAMVGKAGNAVGRAENTWMTAVGMEDVLSKEFEAQIDDYYQKLDVLRKKQAELKNSDAISEEQKADLIAQTNNVNKLTEEISGLIAEYQRLSGENATVIGQNTLGSGAGLDAYEQQLKQTVMTATNGKAQIKNFDAATKTLTYTVKTGKNEFTEYTAAVRNLDGQLVSVQGTTKRTETFLEATKRKMKELTSYMSGMALFSRIGQELRRGIQYVREIDLALTELKKVTDETEETYDKFLDTAAKTGARLGTTISAVTEATATFAKLGYSMEQATEMAEAAIVYKNVGDNIESTGDAADSIISTMKGFRLEATESMEIVDRFNEVGNRFAITSQGIGEALRLSASALSEGGNSLDESIGLITAANEVVNDPSSVGTALKTLTLRLRGSKTELEEMGEDVTDMATTTSQLQAKLLALTGGQVDIMANPTTFKNSTQILREMAEAWKDMDDLSRASALELMGGKRQANVLSALIQNFDTVEKVIETSADSAGSALKENERYLDSIQGKIDQFNNAMQAMWSDTLESDMVKGIVEIGTEIIKFIDKIGLLPTVLGGVFLYFTAFKKNNPITLIKDIGSSFVNAGIQANKYGASLSNLTMQQQAAKMAASGLTQQEIAAQLVKQNGIEQNKAEAIAEEAVTAAKLKQSGVTAQQVMQDWSENQVTLSNTALDWLEKQSTDALTHAKLQEALASGAITKQDYLEIAAKYGLLTATESLKLGVQGLGATIKAAMASNPIGWIMMAISAVVMLVQWVSTWKSKTEKLTEELKELQAELQDIKSDIEAVNSELETTNDRMTELLAKDKLSFVEEEELKALKKRNEELQREIDLLELKEKQTKKDVADKFVETMDSDVNTDTGFGNEYRGTGKEIKKLKWYDWVFDFSESYLPTYRASENDYIQQQVAIYQELQDEISVKEKEILEKDGTDKKSQKERKKLEKQKKKLEDEAAEVESYINGKTTEWDELSAELDYGINDETDAWLDYINNMQDKWAIASGGKNAKANAITRIFNKNENTAVSDSIDEYVEDLKRGDVNAKSSIENIIKNNEALVEDLKASGLSADEAVDYFTSFASELEFATLEGKIVEMQHATSKMRELFSDPTFSDFDSLFNVETGEISETAIAEYFQGTSEATRAEIAKLIKDIKDGEISVENALKQFEIFSIQSSLDIYITEVQTNFKDVFVDLEDADGLISTFEELGEAIGSAASALDTLNQAQAEMAYSGHVSIETALQLMEYTDDYGSVLQVVDGKLQLVEGAENNLIQARINAIKTSAEASLSDATNAYNKAVLATQEYKSALTTDMSAEVVAKSWEKVLAAGAGLWEGIKSLITDESWTDAYNRGYNTTLSKITGYETEYNDSGLQALAEAEADAKALMEQAQDRVELANQLTPETLESIHSSDEASGGNDTKEEVEDDRFQREMDYWENRIAANQSKYEQLQNEIDLLEAKGQKADASYYEEQVQLEGQRLTLLEGQKAAALAYLATLEEGSEEWWEVANTLNDIEGELDDVTASIVDLQDAIGEIDIYKFEEFNNRLDDITSKLGTIRDLIAPDKEDWFNDQGEWTEEGVAVLGTYIQELETYKNGLAEVNAERAKYAESYTGNEDYYASLGIHSEQEYYDKVQELTEQQYDYAESINDTEQSVVDMYESNIDAIEEYTETLIDSYNDYIDSVKEALDAERDLYDFKKNVQKQSKDIAAIERRIASLSGSTNASDVAERRKLEAQLYESRESLNDTYYDHARSSQDEALDAEQTAYEESMTKFVEGLRVSLDQATTNMDEFLMGVTSMVMYNADTVLTKYQETNLPLTDELTNPWIKAKEAVGTYSGDALALMNRWTEEGGFFAQFNTTGTKNLKSPWSAGSTAANAFKTSVDTVMKGVVSNISTNVKTASGELSKLYQQIKDTEKRASEAKVVVNPNPTPTPSPSPSPSPQPTPEPTVKLRGLMQTSKEMILGSKSFVDENTETINGTKYYRDSKTGYYYKISDLNSKRKYDGGRTTGWAIPKGTWFYTKHAKGTTGTDRDEWAITDEPQFGDELVLVPGKDGNLSFMRKGTGVVPADMTQKLFELAQIPTSDLMNKNLTAIVPNITKNDFKNEFNFESLVHVDTVDSDTLPKLEKMVDKKIDDFSKALNYSLKRFAR